MNLKSVLKFVSVLSITASVTLVAGCCHLKLPQQNFVKSARDLGGVHITVLPPVDFETYRNRLSPGFNLTGDAALEKVAPYTSRQQDSSFTGAATGLAVGLPSTSVTDTSSLTDTGADITTSDTSETKKQSDSIPSTSGVAEETKRVLATTPPSGDIARLDPITQYWAATALFQEVQLLNRFVGDIDLGGKYHAYVVRLQVAQIPYVRRAPYDCIVDLSFFTIDDNTKATTSLPIVLPMLVTDSLESSQYNLHAEQVRQLALALQGMVYHVGVNFGSQWYRQIVSDILGRDLNSLLTVARLQDNILRVRLGAMQQAGGIFAVVPRTQNITVVLLVDKKRVSNGDLVVASKTTWRNTVKAGKPLPPLLNVAQDSDYRKRVDLLVKNAGVPNKLSDTQYSDLVKTFQDGRYDDFMKILQSCTRSDSVVAKNRLLDLLEEKATENNEKRLAAKVQAFTKAAAKVDVDTVASMFTDNQTTTYFEKLLEKRDLVEGTPLTNLGPRVTAVIIGDKLGGYDNKLIWAAFGSMFAESCFDRTVIALPKAPQQPTISTSATTGGLSQATMLYMFDDKKAISVTVPRLGKVFPTRVYGQADFTYSDNADASAHFELLSTATAATATGDGVELTFPSALDRCLPKTAVKSLSLYWLNDDGNAVQLGEFKDVHLVPPATEIKPGTKITITDNNKFIAINANDSGSLRLHVEKYSAADNPVLLVTGARLDSSDNVAVALPDKNTLKIKGTGSFTITLGNLADGVPVSLILNASAKGVNAAVGNLTAKLNKK